MARPGNGLRHIFGTTDRNASEPQPAELCAVNALETNGGNFNSRVKAI